jgi:hypothetical protein
LIERWLASKRLCGFEGRWKLMMEPNNIRPGIRIAFLRGA